MLAWRVIPLTFRDGRSLTLRLGRASRLKGLRKRKRSIRAMRRALLCLSLLVIVADAAIIKTIHGADKSELSHCSSGGGCHVYLRGTNLGTPFAPPSVFVGARSQVECKVQSFSSAKNRLHCIIQADGAPAPSPIYKPDGIFVDLPILVIKDGKRANCWHKGGINDGCTARFDVGATPRVVRILTPIVER